jgi:HSP20 family protein
MGVTKKHITRGTSPLAFRGGAIDDQFGRMVENMFQEFLAPLAQGARLSGEGLAMPRLDVSENEKAFEVQAELPGVKKEDLKVSIDGQRVTIEGECQQANEQRQGEQVVYSERSTRRYQRSFTLPTEVDDAGAEAKLENGVLMLTLPKKQGGAAKRLTIQ